MFTVLIRYKKSRREVLTPATSIEFVHSGYGEEPGLLITNSEGSVFLDPTSKDDEDFRDVFVMNAQGQTVARYVL